MAGLDVAVSESDRCEAVVFENPPGPPFINHRKPGSIQPDSRFPGWDDTIERPGKGLGVEGILASDLGHSIAVDAGNHDSTGLLTFGGRCIAFCKADLTAG